MKRWLLLFLLLASSASAAYYVHVGTSNNQNNSWQNADSCAWYVFYSDSGTATLTYLTTQDYAAPTYDTMFSVDSLKQYHFVAVIYNSIGSGGDDIFATPLDTNDVSALALEASVTALRDSADEMAQVADVSALALEASVTALRDSADEMAQVADVSALALEASVTAIRDSMEEAAQVADVSGLSTFDAATDGVTLAATGTDADTGIIALKTSMQIVLDSVQNNQWWATGSGGSGGCGSGPDTIDLYVLKASDSTALAGAIVSYFDTGGKLWGETDSTGKISFGATAGSHTSVAFMAGWYASSQSMTAPGADTFYMTSQVIAAGSAPNMTTVWGQIFYGADTLKGAEVKLILEGYLDTLLVIDSAEQVAFDYETTTDSNGVWQLNVPANSNFSDKCYYSYTVRHPRIQTRTVRIVVPDTAIINVINCYKRN